MSCSIFKINSELEKRIKKNELLFKDIFKRQFLGSMVLEDLAILKSLYDLEFIQVYRHLCRPAGEVVRVELKR